MDDRTQEILDRISMEEEAALARRRPDRRLGLSVTTWKIAIALSVLSGIAAGLDAVVSARGKGYGGMEVLLLIPDGLLYTLGTLVGILPLCYIGAAIYGFRCPRRR